MTQKELKNKYMEIVKTELWEDAPEMWGNLEKVKKLDTDDIQRIIDGLQEVRKSFDKRLNTYLKRYGLSKINAWSYICD